MTAHALPIKRRTGTSLTGLLVLLALVTTLCPPVVAQEASEELGRLFFTPERRQHLDRQRQLNIRQKQEIPEDPTFTVNGVVTRSDGKRTVWINGTAQNENDTASGISVVPSLREPGKVIVRPTAAPAGKAMVGDTVNRNTGQTTDLLDGGRIQVPAKAGAKK